MANTYFQFKQFTVHQELASMKVCTDACLFGAWVAKHAPIQRFGTTRGLDIGTGTGLLSLMLVQQTTLEIDAIDIDDNAVKQCLRNVKESPWPGRIKVHSGNILSQLPSGQYDLIISNPPFFSDDLKSPEANRNLAKHEDGLPLDKLFAFSKLSIRKSGVFALLLPARRAAVAFQLAQQYDFSVLNAAYVMQTARHQPFRLMLIIGGAELKKSPEPPAENIIIREDAGYGVEFSALLEPYYLHC